jgi:hypothetical protein
MFIAALFAITKLWKQPICPTTVKCDYGLYIVLFIGDGAQGFTYAKYAFLTPPLSYNPLPITVILIYSSLINNEC